MGDRPILFSGPMVRALLAGRKTQTRRVLEQQGDGMHLDRVGPTGWQFTGDGGLPRRPIRVRYSIGDRLWVREAWRSDLAYDDLSPSAMGGEEPIRYEADGSHQTWGYPALSKTGRVRAGMHMPRWASRLTLTVTDVRVQRLQEIDQCDAEAEGVDCSGPVAVNCYRVLWDSLNAGRGFGWDTNPWIVAVSFDVERANIDALRSKDGAG